VTATFISKLADRTREINNFLCMGIAPPCDPKHLEFSSFFLQEWQKDPLKFIASFSRSAINAARGKVPMVKFQSAYFEAFGADGMKVLSEQIKLAKDSGLLVLWDAKRGDISSTMSAYGHAAFETLDVDAMTITPYLGPDVYAPLKSWAQNGKGLYVVWTTSNSSARVFQNAKLANGQQFNEFVLEETISWFTENNCTGGLGFVLGATRFDELSRQTLEKLIPFAVLMPGVGPQGGQINTALTQFMQSSAAASLPMSRGLTGLGDDSQNQELKSINSWDAYQDYIVSILSVAAMKATLFST
jgi:orotidine-5'-phosphate decarboxylase